MKYILYSFMFLSVSVHSQNIKVIKNEQITQLKDGEFIVASVSPDGENLLVSTPGYKGLFLINLPDRKIRSITDKAGAGYEPSFSPDGKEIYFRTDEFIQLKKYSSLIRFDLLSGREDMLQSKSRDLSPPKTVGNKLIYTLGGKHTEITCGPDNFMGKGPSAYVTLENLKPVLYEDGEKRILTPSGDGNYIWISLSPDRTRLLYNYVGKGTFVSDLHGNIIASLGRFDAPRWLNNQIIIGMNDKDDGYRIISSDIISYSLITGVTTNLTSTSDNIEMDPVPLEGGNKVYYHTVNGELFVLYLDLK